MKNKFKVPYIVSYDRNTMYWEVIAYTKLEAREIAVKELASDQDVTHIAGVNYVVDLGKAERGNYYKNTNRLKEMVVMENNLMDLVKKMRASNVKREEETVTRFGETITYDYHVIKADDDVALRFWNSSNSQDIHSISEVLDDIRNEILDGETGGSLSDGWNEIMWEIIE